MLDHTKGALRSSHRDETCGTDGNAGWDARWEPRDVALTLDSIPADRRAVPPGMGRGQPAGVTAPGGTSANCVL
jgi:hypothetical protein